MNCKELRGYFPAYIDGDAPGDIAGRIREHLEECGACRSELGRLKDVVEGLHSMEDLDAPADLLVRVREKIDKESALRRLYRFLFIPLKVKVPVEALSLALILVLFTYALQFIPGKMEVPFVGEETVKLAEEPGEKKAVDYGPGVGARARLDKKMGRGMVVAEGDMMGDVPPAAGPMKVASAPVDRYGVAESKVAQQRRLEAGPGPPGPSGVERRGLAVGRVREITLPYRDRDGALRAVQSLVADLGGEVLVGGRDEGRGTGEDVIVVAVAPGSYSAFVQGVSDLKEVPGVETFDAVGGESGFLEGAAVPLSDKADADNLLKKERLAFADAKEELVRVRIRLVPEGGALGAGDQE